MPTLLSSQSTQHHHHGVSMHSDDVPPTGTGTTADDATTTAPAIILSFNGVDFKLSSMTSSSEVSYKNESDNLILSLTGFTGTLMVSKTMMTSLSSSGIIANTNTSTSTSDVTSSTTAGTTSRTVEDDPNSPETKTETTKKSKKVSPGQQTLPFITTGATTAVTKKSSKTKSSKIKKTKKRTTVALAAKPPTNSKRSRTTSAINTPTTTNSTSIDSFLPPISMGQASQATQPTQLEDDDIDAAAVDEDDVRVITTTDTTTSSMMMMETNETKKKTNAWNSPSVQDILDGSDSVATVRDGDDDDIDINIDADDSTKNMEDQGDDNSNNEDDGDNGIATNNNVINSESASTGEGITYPNPPARWGHTMTVVEKDKILVYGGASYDTNGDPIILSDVHVYDPKNGGSWHAPINCRGEARQWHSSTYIPGRQQIIAFGGEQTNNKGKTITSDTLRVLDTEIMLWYPPAVSGDVPTGRSGHTATFFPETNELILFGGVRGSKWLNSVSILDVTRWIWTTPNIVGTAPKPRSYHSATVVGSQKMVVFGGNNKSSCFDTVHVLEATSNGSESTTNNNNGGIASTGWKWSNPTIRGKAPFARTGHSATLLEDGKTIMVYGGWDPNEEDELTGEENIFKGSYMLDTQEWTWKEGPAPQPDESTNAVQDCGPKRCGHAAALNSENGEVFVFGGRILGESLAGDVQRLVPPQEKTVHLES